jgi:opacity protein-like surface antigen
MKSLLACAFFAVSLFTTAALADDVPPPYERPSLVTGLGMDAEIGGGVQRFIDVGARSITNVGGNWTARLILGTRSHLGAEAAYVGSAQGMNVLGLSDSAVLVSNGVEGALRFNMLTGDWQPYALAGYTFRRYTIQNAAVNTSSVLNADNVSEIPVAVGIAYRVQGFVADLRFNYNNAFNSALIPDSNLSTYGVSAKVGFEF